MKNLKTLDKYRDTEFERKYYGFNGDAGNGTTCSECMQGLLRINGKQSEWVDLSGMPYCPNCGAKMEVPNDD